MTDYTPDLAAEQRCLGYIQAEYAYGMWPRADAEYIIAAKGGTNIAYWIDHRLGWWRNGGPADQIRRMS